ncbi:GOLPH3/VPS74 family protein [Stackebrandtia soli]|uniref:GOLPH3/VPS74 family protein n=1 Tax=Stackebrandtia soli TaxID=1892856 RepID=UPI0039EB59E7
MQLADECWLVAHDDVTGRSLLPPRIAGVAAAAGLMCEMIHARIVAIDSGRFAVRNRKPSPDLLQHTITDFLMRESHPIDTWLRFFARTAEDDVAKRLIRRGVLEEQRSRSILGKTKRRFVPMAATRAAWPTARLAKRLSRAQPVDSNDQILIGWLDAVGMNGHVLWDDPQQVGSRYLEHIVAHLPGDYRTLCAETKTLVGQIVMANNV